jgi:hypothetical protein
MRAMLAMFLGLAWATGGSASTAFWMGNSFSMGLPGVLDRMWSQAAPFTLTVTEHFYGGTSLQGHWEDHRADTLIAHGDFDFVIMQSFQWAGFGSSSSDSLYAAKFAQVSRGIGAEPLLEITQLGAMASLPEWDRCIQSYVNAAQRLNLRVIPCAQAWRLAISRWPGIYLWRSATDSVHQGRYGEMLNAYVFYGFFTGRTPVGHPYTNSIASDTARFLQTAAWDALQGVTTGVSTARAGAVQVQSSMGRWRVALAASGSPVRTPHGVIYLLDGSRADAPATGLVIQGRTSAAR